MFGAPAPAEWQQQMRLAIRNLDALLEALSLTPEDVRVCAQAARDFPVLVPPAMLARMRAGDARDPLLLQVLPRYEESLDVSGYVNDPLAESAAVLGDGMLQKYAGRLLLISTAACAVHCRYCFRRHFPYADHQAAGNEWRAVLAALRADPTLRELILSGGDPLMLADRRLASLFTQLRDVPGLRRVRLHTRMPVVLPQRVDDGLLATLALLPCPVVMVLHVNHARELDATTAAALARLSAAGVTLLNQAVLLRDINDDVASQTQLWTGLFDQGVLPYYLHLLDPVAGAAHFNVPEPDALALMAALRARLPGYLVPRLAREQPGHPAKTVLA
ncbi:MAG: EF-P beta-lysylation protein EpmB [Gammaproteobacteria bacterium]|nr:EF-P beta-lysylation protein EpmB [Gammaproteobacteria bacterium]